MAFFPDRKRPTPVYTDDELSSTGLPSYHSTKRPRLDSYPTNTFSNPSSSSRSDIDSGYFSGSLATPSPSANTTNNRKVSLKLIIPDHVLTRTEKRQLAVRRTAAIKWERSGKLQRPEPDQKEISSSYNLKLMRHYPAADADPSESTHTASQDCFVKPIIQKSSRVTNLLANYPYGTVPTKHPDASSSRGSLVGGGIQDLQRNRQITENTLGTQLAWRSFSWPDRGEREIMVESALGTDDLEREIRGLPNSLPEWKKFKTSQFAKQKLKNLRTVDDRRHTPNKGNGVGEKHAHAGFARLS
ncbi:unnamed protein product [Periconia digitata]|uniref:Uncharacterized protein n=1 Tax=Periconia digitata TaxID=1303443 RepID=A0A9W4USH6_9PLEO|nr:unnamed protein product [Periconia digitata]